jgi:hypothetical protein
MTSASSSERPGVILARTALERLDGTEGLLDIAKCAGGALLHDGTILSAHVKPFVPGSEGHYGQRGTMDYTLNVGEDWRVVSSDETAILLRSSYSVVRGGTFANARQLTTSAWYRTGVKDNGRALGLWNSRAVYDTTSGPKVDALLNAPNDFGEFRVVRFASRGQEAVLHEAIGVLAESMGDIAEATRVEFANRAVPLASIPTAPSQ